MKQLSNIHKTGFTIVELVIVIVVIVILATISTAAYGAVQTRADDTAVKTTVAKAMQSINLFYLSKKKYPDAINDCPTPAANNVCFDTSGVVYSGAYNSAYPAYAVGAIQGKRFYYASDAETSGDNEFVQYADLAPIINAIGLKSYKLTFDIKSADVSSNRPVVVYFQNGSNSRHDGLYQEVTVTTSFTTKTLTFTPTLRDAGVAKSTLAFYGTYGTGNIPTVKNLKFEPNY